MSRKRTRDGIEILARRYGDDKKTRRRIERAKLNVRVAQAIHDARVAAGISQTELARRVGTRQQVISRLEDADYDGHSLTMLRRIAEALGLDLDVRFVGTPRG